MTRIDLSQPITFNAKPARYVGKGTDAWPIVAECTSVLGAQFIAEFNAEGKPRSGGAYSLVFSEIVEEEDWS